MQVPPATPIPAIQEVGQSLGIAPEKLTVDRLMEDPADSAPSSADVEFTYVNLLLYWLHVL